MSKTFSLKSELHIPVTLDKAWEFFSDPSNLAEITPPVLDFKIRSRYPLEKIHAGQIIEYSIRLPGLFRSYWMTEITHVDFQKCFVDEQRFGPYSFWHHRHHFKQVSDGTLMADIVYYRLPWGILGSLAHRLYIKKQLDNIFSFRSRKIHEIFVLGNPIAGQQGGGQ